MPRLHRRKLLTLLALAPLALAGCSDDGTGPDEQDGEAESVAGVRLVIGNTTVTIDDFGQVTGGPVLIGAVANVTATFLDADGNPVDGLDDFELRINPVTALVTFNRTGRFAGTLNRNASGSTVLNVQLFHLEEGHADWEKQLGITIQ